MSQDNVVKVIVFQDTTLDDPTLGVCKVVKPAAGLLAHLTVLERCADRSRPKHAMTPEGELIVMYNH